MNIRETTLVSLRSIRSNMLRSVLTVLIIAVGITCLVGILTAIDTLLFSMNDSFNRIGANSYSIFPGGESIQTNRNGRRSNDAEPISFRQASQYKSKYQEKFGSVSLSLYCGNGGTVSFGDKKTNPTVKIVGVDAPYMKVAGYELDLGRNFTQKEIESGTPIAVIGKDVVKSIFGGQDAAAIGQSVRIDNAKYKVIGVLAAKGSTFSNSGDRRVFIPLGLAKKYYGRADSNYDITASVDATAGIDESINGSIGIMRNVRRIEIGKPNDFRILKSDGILNRLKDMTSQIRISTIVIAMMTLLGAAIGLMNIMLVTVTERTKEIGIRKAVGAPIRSIMFQFLFEAIVICLIGGIVGIIFGIGIGFGVAFAIKGKFIIPFKWMALGFVTCVVVGVISGFYPAYKASRLDPIESLRYE